MSPWVTSKMFACPFCGKGFYGMPNFKVHLTRVCGGKLSRYRHRGRKIIEMRGMIARWDERIECKKMEIASIEGYKNFNRGSKRRAKLKKGIIDWKERIKGKKRELRALERLAVDELERGEHSLMQSALSTSP